MLSYIVFNDISDEWLYILIFYINGTINISLIVSNIVFILILSYVAIQKLKFFSYNPYRTYPTCLTCLILSMISLAIININYFFDIPYNFLTASFIWISIVMNVWFSLYTILIWRGLIIINLLIHTNMLMNASFLTYCVFITFFMDKIYLLCPLVGIGVTFLFFIILKLKKLGPAPATFSTELELITYQYIKILKNKMELDVLDGLSKSTNNFVRENAKKTRKLYLNKEISKSNMRNNLFLLMLIDNNIPIGKYRKIYYKKYI